MDLTQRIESLRSFAPLAPLPQSLLLALAERLQEVRIDAGEMLFKEGEPGESMAFVLDGILEAHQIPIVGGEVMVGRIYAGELVGEMACLDPGPRSATIAAVSDATALILERSDFLDLEQDAPALRVAVLREVMRELSVRLRDTNRRIDLELTRLGAAPATRAPEVTGTDSTGEDPPKRLDLRKVPCLRGFSNAELQALVSIAPPRSYPTGHVLCQQGGKGDCSWVLARGKVGAYRRLGRESRFLATLEDGSVLGHMALIDGSPRSARLVVESKSILLRVPSEAMRSLLETHSPFAMKLQREISISGIRALRNTTRALALLLGSDPQRISPEQSRARARAPAVPTPAGAPDTLLKNTARLSYVRAAANEWGLTLDGFDHPDAPP